MKNNKKYFLNIVILSLITILVLYFALRDDFANVLVILSDANYFLLLIAFLLIVLTHYLCAITITRLLKNHYPSLKVRDTFKTRLLEQFARGVTPYQTGGQAMQCYALDKFGVSINHSIYALSIDFIIYQCTAVIFQLIFIAGYLFEFYDNSFIFYGVIIATVINFFILVLLFLLLKWSAFHHFIAHSVLRFLTKIKVIKNYEKTKATLEAKVDEFAEQIHYISQEKKLVFINALIYFLNLIILHSIPFVVSLALHLPITLELFLYSMALSVFVNAFNALNPIPGATGGTEAVFMLLYGYVLTQTLQVKSLMIGWRFITFYSMIIVGSIYFIHFMSQNKKKGESL